MHAIVVSKDYPKNIYTGYNMEFKTDEFGWEHRKYYDPDDKAHYLWTAIVHNFVKKVYTGKKIKYTNWEGKENEYDEYHVALDVDNPRYKKIKQAIIDALVSIGYEDDGYSITFQESFKDDGTEFIAGITGDWGYIDHCPEIEFAEALVFNKDRLIRYLFNDESMIETWNDNSWSYPGEDTDDDPADDIRLKYFDENNDLRPGMKLEDYYDECDWLYFGRANKVDYEWRYLKKN